MYNGFLLISLLALGYGVSGVPFTHSVENNEVNPDPDFVTGLNKCTFQTDTDSIASCATERIVRSLDDLSSRQNVEILPGVTLLSDGEVSKNFRAGKELRQEIEEAKSNHGSMFQLIGNATARFFAGRTLKVKLPSSEQIGRALEEGRKRMGGNKNKGGMKMGMMGIGAAIAGLVPLFLGKVALIAAKALIVGKIALILSAILLFQMFRGNNNRVVESSWNAAPQVSYGPPVSSYGPPATSYGVPSAQYPYSRSFNTEDERSNYRQELAYSSQKK